MKHKRQERRYRTQKRVRAEIFGTAKRPRLSVFRTPKHIYAQLIDDEKAKTILSVNDIKLKKHGSKSSKDKHNKVAIAFEVGKLIAEKALEKEIKQVVFDRGGHRYHGRVKAVAEGAREGGLKF